MNDKSLRSLEFFFYTILEEIILGSQVFWIFYYSSSELNDSSIIKKSSDNQLTSRLAFDVILRLYNSSGTNNLLPDQIMDSYEDVRQVS